MNKKEFKIKSIFLIALIIAMLTSIGCLPNEDMNIQQINPPKQTVSNIPPKKSATPTANVIMSTINLDEHIKYKILGIVTATICSCKLNNLNELDRSKFYPHALASQCDAIIGIRLVPYVIGINGNADSSYVIYGTAVKFIKLRGE